MDSREIPVLVVCESDRFDSVRARLQSRYDAAAVDERERLEEALADSTVVCWSQSVTRFDSAAPSSECDGSEPEGLLVAVSEVESDGSVIRSVRTERVRELSDLDALGDRIERLRLRAAYDELLAEYAAMITGAGSKSVVDRPPTAVEKSSDAAPGARIETIRSELDAVVERLEPRDYEAAFGSPDFAGRSRIQEVTVPPEAGVVASGRDRRQSGGGDP
ncbi:hypothetical protein [Halovivax sp.]|uniref:hypothetical protein n=1 Tax=Halovivax sp. TaxID=1935978 RepID=UPI0025BD4645|nr:hypothetical protein [Halovivax sp.]